MWRFALLCCVFVGCGSQPTLNIKSLEGVQSEITRVSASLDPAKATEFKTAAEVLALHATRSATSEEAQKLAPIAALNGKTPDAIIAEYNKLDPAFRRATGTAIAEVRDLKAANDHRERALKAIHAFENDPKHKDSLGVSRAIVNAFSAFEEKRKSEGLLPAAKWYDEETAKGIDYFIKEYGPGSKYEMN